MATDKGLEDIDAGQSLLIALSYKRFEIDIAWLTEFCHTQVRSSPTTMRPPTVSML